MSSSFPILYYKHNIIVIFISVSWADRKTGTLLEPKKKQKKNKHDFELLLDFASCAKIINSYVTLIWTTIGP